MPWSFPKSNICNVLFPTFLGPQKKIKRSTSSSLFVNSERACLQRWRSTHCLAVHICLCQVRVRERERERERSIFLLGQYGNKGGQLWNGKKLVHFVVTFGVFFSHNYHNHRQTKRNWKKKNSQSNFWGKGLFQRGNKKSVLEGISPKERQTQRVHEDPCGCCFFFFLLVHWYSYSSNTTHPLVQTLLLPKPCLFWLILALCGCVFIKRGLTLELLKFL